MNLLFLFVCTGPIFDALYTVPLPPADEHALHVFPCNEDIDSETTIKMLTGSGFLFRVFFKH